METVQKDPKWFEAIKKLGVKDSLQKRSDI